MNKKELIVELQSDRALLMSVVRRLVPLSSLIGVKRGSVFCPFHRDERHPSAKLYPDADGERLYCFAERRQYSSYEYLVKVGEKEPLSYLFEKYKVEEIYAMIARVKEKVRTGSLDDRIDLDEYFKEGFDICLFLKNIYRPEKVKR